MGKLETHVAAIKAWADAVSYDVAKQPLGEVESWLDDQLAELRDEADDLDLNVGTELSELQDRIDELEAEAE